MKLRINEKSQAASGGSFVAKFHAMLTISPGAGATQICVANTIPKDPDPNLLKLTLDHIARGIDSVLHPRDQSAIMTIHDLVIHDVDCRPTRYESATAKELERLLKESARLPEQ
jgi:hypothetical protein